MLSVVSMLRNCGDAMHVDEDDSLKWGLIDSKGRKQQAIFINESGLYSLVLSSKLPQAKAFKRWAPPTENDTRKYISDLCKLTGFGGKERLTENEWPRLVHGAWTILRMKSEHLELIITRLLQ